MYKSEAHVNLIEWCLKIEICMGLILISNFAPRDCIIINTILDVAAICVLIAQMVYLFKVLLKNYLKHIYFWFFFIVYNFSLVSQCINFQETKYPFFNFINSLTGFVLILLVLATMIYLSWKNCLIFFSVNTGFYLLKKNKKLYSFSKKHMICELVSNGIKKECPNIQLDFKGTDAQQFNLVCQTIKKLASVDLKYLKYWDYLLSVESVKTSSLKSVFKVLFFVVSVIGFGKVSGSIGLSLAWIGLAVKIFDLSIRIPSYFEITVLPIIISIIIIGLPIIRWGYEIIKAQKRFRLLKYIIREAQLSRNKNL